LSQIADFTNAKESNYQLQSFRAKDAFVEKLQPEFLLFRNGTGTVSKQRNLDKIYELVSVEPIVFYRLGLFSTISRNNPTTEASLKSKALISNIDKNLVEVLFALNVQISYTSIRPSRGQNFLKETASDFMYLRNIGIFQS